MQLLDATGEPLVAKNMPDDEFEKKAVKLLKSGKSYYDEVVNRDGKNYLRAVTPIPVVLKKCTLYHENELL